MSDAARQMPDWTAHEVEPGIRIALTADMPLLGPALEAAVDRCWAQAQARCGGKLFNGRVFSADTLTPTQIGGHWTEFRRIVAQMEEPALYADLRVRPLAVGGLILGTDETGAPFVLLGRRPAQAVYQAGEWQLPPAGSIDPGAVADDGGIDAMFQFHAELEEELGIARADVTVLHPLCIVEHAGSHVLDFGILATTRLTPEQVMAAHAERGNGEYDPLIALPTHRLQAFLAENAGAVTRQAPVFLAQAGLVAR